jgi:Family of unknown function (DUF6444)
VERSEAEAIYAQGREPVVDALVALSTRLEAQDAQLAALAERVEDLEQRLKRDSRNSSLPPSHDPPWLGRRASRLGQQRGTRWRSCRRSRSRSLSIGFSGSAALTAAARFERSCRLVFLAAVSVRSWRQRSPRSPCATGSRVGSWSS